MTGNVPGDARVEGRKHRRDVSLRKIFVGLANITEFESLIVISYIRVAPPAELAPPLEGSVTGLDTVRIVVVFSSARRRVGRDHG